MGESEKCGLYVDDNPPCLVALGRVYEGSTTVHNVPLGNDQVKVNVEEVWDVDAQIPIPTQEIQLVRQTVNTFLAWPTHLVQPFSEQVFPFVVFVIIKKVFVTNKVFTVIDLFLLTV